VKALVTRGVRSFTDTDEVGIYTLSTARGDMKLAVTSATATSPTSRRMRCPRRRAVGAASPPVPIQASCGRSSCWWRRPAGARGVLYWRRQTGGRLRVPS